MILSFKLKHFFFVLLFAVEKYTIVMGGLFDSVQILSYTDTQHNKVSSHERLISLKTKIGPELSYSQPFGSIPLQFKNTITKKTQITERIYVELLISTVHAQLYLLCTEFIVVLITPHIWYDPNFHTTFPPGIYRVKHFVSVEFRNSIIY